MSDEAETDNLENVYKSKSQLFFSQVNYEQRGRYICVASQELKIGQEEAAQRAVSSALNAL